MQFVLPQHRKQNYLTTSSTSSPIAPSARLVSMLNDAFPCPHLHFHPLLLLNEVLQLNLSSSFSPRSPLGFIKAQNIPILPHLSRQPVSRALLLPGLPSVPALPVLTPPPVTTTGCSWKSCFRSSAVSPRDIYESWNSVPHQEKTPWGGEYH